MARDIDLYSGTAQLAALDMDRKQTTISKSSMHQQFVWRCRLDLFSRLLNGDLWKLIGRERREAGRLSHYREEHRKEMAPKNRDDAHEILDWQAPARRVCTDFSEQIHTDVHAGRAHLADKALSDEVMDISKSRGELPLQTNLGFYSSSISEPRQLGRLCGS